MLEGANIKLVCATDSSLVRSDSKGTFQATATTGRYQVLVSFSGYDTYSGELLVIAAHEAVLAISLQQHTTVLNEVEVTGAQPVTSDVPGLRSLSIEKTLRIPANFLDPVRVITAYPGVVASNDQSNSIVVHGNSPNGLLWRLNGLDIVNPNHLSNAGTLSDKPAANGGGTNILSAQMLDRTDFFLGALPANYGNALAGVIDMNFRDGNTEKREYTAQASLIGFDFAAEGPWNKNHNSSFLANYRYSTVGVLSGLGVDFGGEAITFQDFSFNTSFHGKNGGKLTVFGLGGLSKNDFLHKDSTDREEDKDWYDIHYTSATYAVGASYDLPLRNGGRFAAGAALSSTSQERNADLYYEEVAYHTDNYYYKRDLISGYIRYTKQVGEKTFLEAGANVSYMSDTLSTSHLRLNAVFNTQPCVNCNGVQTIEGKMSGLLLQPYFSLRMAFSSKAGLVAGVRYVSYSYGKASTAEPRLSFYVHPSRRSSIDIAYGLVSQLQQPVTYLARGNQDLGLTKAQHFNVGYHQSLGSSLKLSSLLYFQEITDVPVELAPGSVFSTVNLMETESPGFLLQRGGGRNYGIDLLLEKSFYNQNYFSLGGSIYNSTYTTADNRRYDSRFNGKYTFTGVYGREWTKPSKNRTISVNTRVLYLGGMREQPINEGASLANYETTYITATETPYSVKLKDYKRVDLRVSFRKNKPGYTRTFSIDIQNLLGTENEAYHRYEFSQLRTITKYQLGLIPVIVYRIDF